MTENKAVTSIELPPPPEGSEWVAVPRWEYGTSRLWQALKRLQALGYRDAADAFALYLEALEESK